MAQSSWIEKIVASAGYDISAGTGEQRPGKRVLDWVSGKDADRTQELTLDQLRSLWHRNAAVVTRRRCRTRATGRARLY